MLENKERGFTLIEVVATIFIISLITVLLLPTMLNRLNDQKGQISDLEKQIIYEATQLYIEDNNEYFKNKIEGESYCINIETLVEAKKLSKPLIDVKTKKEIPLNSAVRVTVGKGNSSDYEIIDNRSCEGVYEDFTQPVISANYESYTDKIKIQATCSDPETEIARYEYSNDDGKTWINGGLKNKYTFDKLKAGEVYKIKVRCTNGKGMKSVVSKKVATKELNNPTFEIYSKNPSDTEYAQSKEIKIKYDTEGIENGKYYYKTTMGGTSSEEVRECGNEVEPNLENCSENKTTEMKAGYWYEQTNNNEPIITIRNNGTIYALISDEVNISGLSTYGESKIDSTIPNLILGTVLKTTTSMIIPYTATDSESEIKETTCEYGTSESYGSNGTVANNTCTISDLTSGQTYYYKLTTTNGSGLTKEVKENTQTGKTTVSFDVTSIQSDTEEQIKKVKITYTISNVTNPTYYFKSTVNATSDVDVSSCGTEENPGNCSGATTTITADTWYKTTSTTPSITFTSNGTLYGMIHDGKDYLTASTQTIIND